MIIFEPPKIDSIPPLIILNVGNELHVSQGDVFVDPGATAYDAVDKNLDSLIVITGHVDMSKEGTYILTYTVKDKSNNSTSITRTVIVEYNPGQDTTAPVLTLDPPDTVRLAIGQNYDEPGFKAIDNHDGDITSKVVITNNIKTDAGIYHVTYTVFDKANNTVSLNRTVIVSGGEGDDFTPPDITLKGSATMSITVGSVWSEIEPGYTAKDDVDGDITDKVTVNGTVNTSTPGVYTLTYAVKDQAGNFATPKTRTVTVTGTASDTVPPVITLKGKNPDTTKTGTAYVDSGYIAMDDVDKDISANVIKTGTVDVNKEGTYTITYNVSDAAGNPAIAVIRTVVVKGGTIIIGDLLEKYGVPSPTKLSTIASVTYTSVIVEGTGGPDLSSTNVANLKFNFSSESYGDLWEFAINLKPSFNPNYFDLKGKSTNTFKSAQPGFTLTGSGISGLDGEYYVTGDATKFVWVKKDGSYAIIWTP